MLSLNPHRDGTEELTAPRSKRIYVKVVSILLFLLRSFVEKIGFIFKVIRLEVLEEIYMSNK